MRTTHFRIVMAAAAALAVALPVALDADEAAASAWQGQGQGRGNGGNDDRARGQGNQGRSDDRPQAQGNQGRGNADRPQAQGNQGRGNSDQARGQGNQGRGNDQRPAQARGRSDDDRGVSARARSRARPDAVQLRASVDRLPDPVRRLARSERRSERFVAGAIARASLRGADTSRFRVENDANRVRVRNTRGDILLDIDEDRARNLGHWEMRRLGDRRPNDQSPAFCRSGAGHPVWGREWCLEKGFGLGSDRSSIWSRTVDLDDVWIAKRPERDVLDRGGLIDVLGDVVFGRLAFQSLVLGYDQPLVGRWVADDEPNAPFVLRVTAGDHAVAEFIDRDRDDDVDVLFVAQPRY